MNERHRQAYLKVMDIQPFYLKKVLPYAKEAPQYDYPQARIESSGSILDGQGSSDGAAIQAPSSASRTFQTKTGVSQGGASSKAPQLLDLKAELKGSIESSKRGATPAEADPAQTQSGAINSDDGAAIKANRAAEIGMDSLGDDTSLKFKLRFFHINSELAVIDELPYAEEDGFLPANDALLQSILLALGVNRDGVEFRSESFTWPIDAAIDYQGSQKSAALAMLQGFIAQHHAANKFSNLLVFAGQLEALLVNQDGEQTEHDFKDKTDDFHVTITPSLSAMLSYPLLKKQVWQTLKPLRDRLSQTI